MFFEIDCREGQTKLIFIFFSDGILLDEFCYKAFLIKRNDTMQILQYKETHNCFFVVVILSN